MKQAGCYAISYGIETGSQRILEVNGKENNSPASKRHDECNKTGRYSIHCTLIIGNRGETKATINETIDFLIQVKPDDVGYVGGLWIFPGTVLYQVAKKENLIDDFFGLLINLL